MDKILKTLQVRAENGDENANAVFRDIDGMNQNELADYVYTHDAQLRKILGVKNLVEKDGNPEFTKEYFDLLNQGRAMHDRDPYTKNDVYNQPLKEIPYYMEKFGIPKEHGEYTREQQAKFANAVSKMDRDELANLAWQEGFEGDADQMRNEIARAGERLQQQFYRSGYSPDGSWSLTGKAKNLASSFLAPRISEAHQAGAEASGADIAGDIAEGALNVVPGLGFLGKMAGKIGSKVPRIAASVGANLAESAAVPLAANAIDVGLYSGTGDPRGEWDPERVLAQTAGTIGIKGAVKAGAGNAKNVLELRAGKDAGGSAFKDAMDIVENIGNSTKENIARRQLAMERKAELARNPQYNSQKFLTAKQNKTGYFATADDLADAEDFAIKKAEAERFANTQKAREKYDKIAEQSGLENIKATDIDANGVVTVRKPDGTTEYLQINPDVLLEDDDVINDAITSAWSAKHPEAAGQMEELFNRLSDYGDNPSIIQLPDGRFVKGETVFGTPGKPEVKGKIYTDNFDDGLDATSFTVLKNNDEVPLGQWEGVEIAKEGDPTINVSYKPRDYTVRRELAKDQDFDNLISGRAKWEPYRDVAAQFVGNAAAREGWLGTGGNDLMGKRESALWNRQLDQLRPLVQQGTPEYKQQMVDAIMNVMTFGLDQLPDDVFKANTNAYRAIANQLGSSDWKHNSEVGVADYPTTSYSSAR